MLENRSKYGWRYGREAELLAQERLLLRREKRYEEADGIRNEVKTRYGVLICDYKDTYVLQWHNKGK